MTLVSLGQGTAEFLQLDRRELAALDHGISGPFAVAAAAAAGVA